MRSSRLLRASVACDNAALSPLATSPSSDRASACLTIAALLDPSRLANSASCAAASSDSRTLNFFIATPHRGSLAHRIRSGFSATSAVVAWRTNRKVCARSRLRQCWPNKILDWIDLVTGVRDVVQDFTLNALASAQSSRQGLDKTRNFVDVDLSGLSRLVR